MKIRRIAAYRVELPLHEGSYKWSGGKSVAVFDSTLVRVETDGGLVGHGEVCPLGPAYLPAYAEGVRAGIAVLAPSLIGEDPRELEKLNRRMDALLKGHPYVKSGIDIACWDILGQAAGVPVSTLLGGRYGEDFVLYRAISQESPDGDGAPRRRLSGGGLPALPAQGRRRSGRRRRAHPGGARGARAGRSPHRGCQHRLAAAPGRARRPRRPGRGRLHRAAVRDLRGVPLDPPADGPSRSSSTRPSTAWACCSAPRATARWTS